MDPAITGCLPGGATYSTKPLKPNIKVWKHFHKFSLHCEFAWISQWRENLWKFVKTVLPFSQIFHKFSHFFTYFSHIVNPDFHNFSHFFTNFSQLFSLFHTIFTHCEKVVNPIFTTFLTFSQFSHIVKKLWIQFSQPFRTFSQFSHIVKNCEFT